MSSLTPVAVLHGTIYPIPSGGPTLAEAFSTEGVDEITINGTNFTGKVNVRKYILPDVTALGAYLFQNDTNVEEVVAPNALSVGASAFSQATKLESVTLPKVTTIESNAFYGTARIKKLELPEVTNINGSAFDSCYAEEILLPKLDEVKQSNFSKAKKLKKLVLGNNVTIPTNKNCNNAFSEMGKDVNVDDSEIDLEFVMNQYNRTYHKYLFGNGGATPSVTIRSLTVHGLLSCIATDAVFRSLRVKNSINFPDLVSLNGSSEVFQYCVVGGINFPNLTTLGSETFRNMKFDDNYHLTLPKVTMIPPATFYATTGVIAMTLPVCTEITGITGIVTFPRSLKDLYLPGSTLCQMTATPDVVFDSTFLTDSDTFVHVPSTLLSDYQNATNWADMSSKIVGDL